MRAVLLYYCDCCGSAVRREFRSEHEATGYALRNRLDFTAVLYGNASDATWERCNLPPLDKRASVPNHPSRDRQLFDFDDQDDGR